MHRFISIRRGFTLLQKLMLFESLMEKWYSTYSKLYVYIVEERLAEALTSFKIVDEGQFIRRTDSRWVWLPMGSRRDYCLVGVANAKWVWIVELHVK